MTAALGILMLDTTFERPVGDVGNAASWPFPILYRRVAGASARRVVDGQDAGLLEAFVEAGEDLVAQGACAITTSCGFLILRQRELARRLTVPVGTSSLLQIPQIAALLPRDRTIGVITYDSDSLTPAHFREASVSAMPPVAGLPKGGAFHGVIEGGRPYDREAMEKELSGVVAGLLQQHPEIGALLFECTNLPPFTAMISKRFALPVFDILTFGRWLHAGAAAGHASPAVTTPA